MQWACSHRQHIGRFLDRHVHLRQCVAMVANALEPLAEDQHFIAQPHFHDLVRPRTAGVQPAACAHREVHAQRPSIPRILVAVVQYAICVA